MISPEVSMENPVMKIMKRMTKMETHEDVTAESSSSLCRDMMREICLSLKDGWDRCIFKISFYKSFLPASMLFFHNRKEVTVRQMLFCTICLQIPEQSKQFPSIKHEHEHEDAFVNILAEDT